MGKSFGSTEREKWRGYLSEVGTNAELIPLSEETIRDCIDDWRGGPVDPDNPAMTATIAEVHDNRVTLKLPGGKVHSCPFREIIDSEAVIRFWLSKGKAPDTADFRNPDARIDVRPISNHSYAPALAERIRRTEMEVARQTHNLTPIQLRFLRFLNEHQGWATRKEIGAATGDKQGFSKALGAPTNPPMKHDTLELAGLVERRRGKPPFEYRITPSGKQALTHRAEYSEDCWYFNTDETEDEGKNAHEQMINQSCIAAWGSCRGEGAEPLLQKPAAGSAIFLYRAGYGIVASGTVTEEDPIESQSVFAQHGEYHRRLINLQVLPPDKLLTANEISRNTGYDLPARHILCKIHNSSAAAFIANYFETHGKVTEPTTQSSGFGTPAENKLVEEAAIGVVTKLYQDEGWNVRSVESEKCGFDLKCRKGEMTQDVEVKGISANDQHFIITANEVQQARTNPDFILTVVTLALSESPTITRYSGAEFLKSFDLSAMQYRAIPRGRGPDSAVL